MVAFEIEVMAKKYDRFGWERERGTPAHDRMIMDWISALENYPLDEVREACQAHVRESPKHMPNEGHILEQLRVIRKCKAEAHKARNPLPPEPPRKEPVSAEAATKILKEFGFTPKRMPE